MDDAKGLEDGQTSSPLLLRENSDPGSSSSATAAVILSTLVAVSGSFVFGSAVSRVISASSCSAKFSGLTFDFFGNCFYGL